MANSQAQNFLTNYAAAVNALLDARAKLKAYREFDAATGIVAALTPEDFEGSNAYLVNSTTISDAFASMDELESLLTDFTVNPNVPTARLGHLLKFRP